MQYTDLSQGQLRPWSAKNRGRGQTGRFALGGRQRWPY